MWEKDILTEAERRWLIVGGGEEGVWQGGRDGGREQWEEERCMDGGVQGGRRESGSTWGDHSGHSENYKYLWRLREEIVMGQ